MQEMDTTLIVIEATWEEIADPIKYDLNWHSTVSPNAVLGTITAWSGKYPKAR